VYLDATGIYKEDSYEFGVPTELSSGLVWQPRKSKHAL